MTTRIPETFYTPQNSAEVEVDRVDLSGPQPLVQIDIDAQWMSSKDLRHAADKFLQFANQLDEIRNDPQ